MWEIVPGVRSTMLKDTKPVEPEDTAQRQHLWATFGYQQEDVLKAHAVGGRTKQEASWLTSHFRQGAATDIHKMLRGEPFPTVPGPAMVRAPPSSDTRARTTPSRLRSALANSSTIFSRPHIRGQGKSHIPEDTAGTQMPALEGQTPLQPRALFAPTPLTIRTTSLQVPPPPPPVPGGQPRQQRRLLRKTQFCAPTGCSDTTCTEEGCAAPDKAPTPPAPSGSSTAEGVAPRAGSAGSKAGQVKNNSTGSRWRFRQRQNPAEAKNYSTAYLAVGSRCGQPAASDRALLRV